MGVHPAVVPKDFLQAVPWEIILHNIHLISLIPNLMGSGNLGVMEPLENA
jgi:hypothetical protein